MAVTPSDLTQPAGPLAPSLFPGDDAAAFAARLAAYLTDAAARVTAAGIPAGPVADGAVRAWAEYRAWDTVLQRLATTPASATLVDQGSRTYTSEQLREVRAQRDAALERYRALVPDRALPAAETGAVATSGSTPLAFVW